MIEETLHLEPELFDDLVAQVLDELPQEWAPLLDNLAVIVEEEPGEDDVAANDEADAEILGRYRGRGGTLQLLGGGLAGPMAAAPPEIAIFQGPLERASADEDDLRRLVRDTLVHEIGRILGFAEGDDDEYDMADDEDEDA